MLIKKTFQSFEDSVDFATACKDVGKTEEGIKQELLSLIKWLTEQKHLPQNSLDEATLLKFLLSTKGVSEDARCRIDRYFTVRSFVPHIFTGRDPLSEEIQAINDVLYIGILPTLTEDRSRVMMIKLNKEDPDLFIFEAILKKIFCLIDIWLRYDPSVTRVVVVTDTSGLVFGHVLNLSPARLREAVYCVQNVYPLRIQGLIFLHVKSFMRTAIDNILKPLFKRKIAKRISAYTDDLTAFYEKVPLKMLPSDYGGESPSMEALNQNWIDVLLDHREWLLTSGSQPSDESQRVGKCPYSGPGCAIM